jgi:two-component system, NtrC family, sensor histidine kinase PilS
MPELNKRLLWLMAIRVLVVASALLPYMVDPSGTVVEILDSLQTTVDSPGPANSGAGRILQLVVAAVSFQTLVGVSLLRLERQHLNAIVQIGFDLILISLLLYKFGAQTANLSILYFAVIGVGTFLLRFEGGMATALAASLLYSGIVLGHRSESFREAWQPGHILAPTLRFDDQGQQRELGWFSQVKAWLRPPAVTEVTGVPVGYNLSIHLLGFVTVAFFTSRMARDPRLEQRLAQQTADLARLEVLHRDVIQSISSGLITTDLDGRIVTMNRAAEEILDRRLDTLRHAPIAESGLLNEADWLDLTQNILASEQSGLRSERRIVRPDRHQIVGFTLSQLRDATQKNRGFLLIFQDLTELRVLEERLSQQERMAAIGQMAAGLAHEVGNPLAAITGSVQMLAKSASGNASERKLLDITLRESRRLDRTVKSFLQFSRLRERNLQPFDMATLLAEEIALLRNSEELKLDHRIELDIAEPNALLVADRDQVSQVFWNLVRNALQAMPQGGLLRVSGGIQAGFYEWQVKDTGKGMTELERLQIFQPFKSFFGKGLGLGMAIVYRIIEEHAGEIRVDSALRQGTTIIVRWPMDAAPSAQPNEEST